MRNAIVAVPGVREVHDLHVWTISSGMESLSAHVIASGTGTRMGLLEQLQAQLG